MMHAIRSSLRTLIGRPAFSLTAVVVLMLGIGANAAVQDILYRLLLARPSGIHVPERLSRFYVREHGGAPFESYLIDRAGVEFLAKSIETLGSVTAYARAVDVRIGRGDRAQSVTASFVEPNYFAFLGIVPQYGRFFFPEERNLAGAPHPVVISDRLWRRMGADTSILGSRIELNGNLGAIVGIAPPAFAGIDVDASDAWLLLSQSTFPRQLMVRSNRDRSVLSAAGTVALRSLLSSRQTLDSTILVIAGPLQPARMPHLRSPQVKATLRLSAVSVALLIMTCVTVGNLFLARSVQRRKEIAVRRAIGASRSQLVSLLLTETAILSLVAGVVATALALILEPGLQRLLFPRWHWHNAQTDWPLIAIAGLASIVATFLCGAFPAWRLSAAKELEAQRISAALQQNDNPRLRRVFVAVQTAIAVSLLVLALVVLGSLRTVTSLDIGYDVDRLTYGTVHFDGPVPQMTDAMSRIAERVRRDPQVEMVAIARRGPFNGVGNSDVFLPGQDSALAFRNGPAAWLGVSHTFFETVGLSLLSGRPPQTSDDRSGERIVWINQQMANELWGSADPLGRCLTFVQHSQNCHTVVGIVENTKQYSLTEKPIAAYYFPLSAIPYAENPPNDVIIRDYGERPGTAIASLRDAILREFPDQHYTIMPMRDLLWSRFHPWYANAFLVGFCAFLALSVAVVGVYGVVSHSVTQRRRELGIRLALGASQPSLMWLVLREQLTPIVAGLCGGLVVMLLLRAPVESLLYDVALTDWRVAALASALMLVVVAIASLIPARSIGGLDPNLVLKAE